MHKWFERRVTRISHLQAFSTACFMRKKEIFIMDTSYTFDVCANLMNTCARMIEKRNLITQMFYDVRISCNTNKCEQGGRVTSRGHVATEDQFRHILHVLCGARGDMGIATEKYTNYYIVILL